MTGKPIKFYGNEEVKLILNEIIQTEPGIDNLSQAVRFAILKYNKFATEKNSTKIKAMSKEISIIAEIVSSQAENMATPIVAREGNPRYEAAEKIIESRIQKNKTKQMKYTNKKEKIGEDNNYFLNNL